MLKGCSDGLNFYLQPTSWIPGDGLYKWISFLPTVVLVTGRDDDGSGADMTTMLAMKQRLVCVVGGKKKDNKQCGTSS